MKEAFVFGKFLPFHKGHEALIRFALPKADLYLYSTRDLPFVQDGTRLEEEQRNKLDESHRAILQAYSITFTELTGSWENRFKQGVKHIKTDIQDNY